MQKLFLLLFTGFLLFASCKKDDDCACPLPKSDYDADFVVFPTDSVIWVCRFTKQHITRIDTLFLAGPTIISTASLPYNAIDFSEAAPVSDKNYYSIIAKSRAWEIIAGDTTDTYGPDTTIFTRFRVDTTENILYESFAGPNGNYEMEIVDWDKNIGDTLYLLGYKNNIYNKDSILLGNRYLIHFNSDILQGDIFNFKHWPSSYFSGYSLSERYIIYKNTSIKLY